MRDDQYIPFISKKWISIIICNTILMHPCSPLFFTVSWSRTSDECPCHCQCFNSIRISAFAPLPSIFTPDQDSPSSHACWTTVLSGLPPADDYALHSQRILEASENVNLYIQLAKYILEVFHDEMLICVNAKFTVTQPLLYLTDTSHVSSIQPLK